MRGVYEALRMRVEGIEEDMDSQVTQIGVILYI